MDTVEKTIKDAGFLMRKHVKGIIDMFRNTLMEGEELLGAGVSADAREHLFVTNRRVVAQKAKGFKIKRKEFPISSISSFNVSSKMFSTEIEIVASNNKAEVEGIPADIARELKNLIYRLMSEESGKTAPEADVAEQIRKLAELRDEGILTEEEFAAKKKQLLGI